MVQDADSAPRLTLPHKKNCPKIRAEQEYGGRDPVGQDVLIRGSELSVEIGVVRREIF